MTLVNPRGEPLKKDDHEDQKLIVDFIRNAQGNSCITISFEPEIPEVRTPAQAAAVNVANHIIRSFGLDQGDKQNAESSEAKN
jgi:hypothetical protein